MPAPTSSAPAAGRGPAGDPGVRISDAERTEVADLLSKHYGDGRLDQAEFNERLDQTMRAKTYSDLNGLFADLPPADGPPAAPPPADGPQRPETVAARPPSRRRHRALLIVAVILIAAMTGHALVNAFSPLIWLVLLAAVVFYVIRRPRRSA